MSRRYWISVAAGVCLTGCGSDARDASDALVRIDTLSTGTLRVTDSPKRRVPAWTAVQELEISVAAADSLGFGDVWDLDVDSKGRIVAMIARRHHVRVFTPDGRLLRVLGREGAGPGELRFPRRAIVRNADEVWVSDEGNSRWTVFDSSGRYTHALPRRHPRGCRPVGCGGTDQAGYRVDGWLQSVAPGVFRNTWALLANDTTVVDSLTLPLRRNELATTVLRPIIPFEGQARQIAADQGGVWFAYTDEYLLHRMNWAGDTVVIARLAVEPIALTEEERAAAQSATVEFERGTGVPSASASGARFRPPIAQLASDDSGRVWVARSSLTDGETQFFDVFDANGVRTATLSLPRAVAVHSVATLPSEARPLLIRGDRLYSVRVDEDGDQLIVVWRIRKP